MGDLVSKAARLPIVVKLIILGCAFGYFWIQIVIPESEREIARTAPVPVTTLRSPNPAATVSAGTTAPPGPSPKIAAKNSPKSGIGANSTRSRTPAPGDAPQLATPTPLQPQPPEVQSKVTPLPEVKPAH